VFSFFETYKTNLNFQGCSLRHIIFGKGVDTYVARLSIWVSYVLYIDIAQNQPARLELWLMVGNMVLCIVTRFNFIYAWYFLFIASKKYCYLGNIDKEVNKWFQWCHINSYCALIHKISRMWATSLATKIMWANDSYAICWNNDVSDIRSVHRTTVLTDNKSLVNLDKKIGQIKNKTVYPP
jgi:hypothetical protein